MACHLKKLLHGLSWPMSCGPSFWRTRDCEPASAHGPVAPEAHVSHLPFSVPKGDSLAVHGHSCPPRLQPRPLTCAGEHRVCEDGAWSGS